MTPVLVLAGPTCVGKTGIALELARRIGNAALVNADSRQLFSGLHVGTATPTTAELNGVRAELFGVVPPGQDASLAVWLGQAREVVNKLARDAVQPIVVGGTGLFVTAFSEGYELIPASVDPALRERLNLRAATPEGLDSMRDELTKRNPTGAAIIDMANPRRVIRALELLEAGVVDVSPRLTEPPTCLVVCVDADRTLHRQLVESRAQGMFSDDHLVEEARAALERGVTTENLRKCGIGYPESLEVIENNMTVAQALESVIRRTIRYSKVQRTWFRHHRVDHHLLRTSVSTEHLVGEIWQLWQESSSRPG